MIKKFVRSVSRGRERSTSPEFASVDAARHDRSRSSSRGGDRPSTIRDVELALPGPALDIYTPGGSAVVPFYLDTSLEALSLETLIEPSLGRMRPKIREAEKALVPMPPLPPHQRKGSLTVPEQAHLLPDPPTRRDGVRLQPPAREPTDASSSKSSSSAESEHNPFELEFGTLAPVVTPFPKRPPLQRKAVSYRTQREMPLRVQAVRRSHQEMYARQILAQSPIKREAMQRRASETEVQKRPGPTPLQGRSDARSQSLAHVHSPGGQAPRSRSASRDGSRSRHERLPSGPHRARNLTTEPSTDFYLQAALSSWSFDP